MDIPTLILPFYPMPDSDLALRGDDPLSAIFVCHVDDNIARLVVFDADGQSHVRHATAAYSTTPGEFSYLHTHNLIHRVAGWNEVPFPSAKVPAGISYGGSGKPSDDQNFGSGGGAHLYDVDHDQLRDEIEDYVRAVALDGSRAQAAIDGIMEAIDRTRVRDGGGKYGVFVTARRAGKSLSQERGGSTASDATSGTREASDQPSAGTPATERGSSTDTPPADRD